jgi:tetratricopeptide (TPR) repeat protein
MLLAGCVSVTTQPSGATTEPIPKNTVPQDAISQEAIPQQPGEGTTVEPAPKPVESSNQAVIALLDKARLDTGAGQREAAGASLERALRIEPRNAWLWHELAQLRLAQGQYAQAIALAHKSISFAGHERHLQALNWRVIGNARIAQGTPSEAEKAFKLAEELEQQDAVID